MPLVFNINIIFYFHCRLLNPVLSRVDKTKKKEVQKRVLSESQFEEVDVSNFNLKF